MIKLFQHLWSQRDDSQKWLEDIQIDGRKLDFYAPYENEVDIYHFKIGDILRDTYTNQDYRAVDKIKKKSRWGEERDVFILKSLKTADQFGLEHSPEGFGGLRYHKKYRLLFTQEDWVGYLPLQDLFRPTTRANKEESVLPTQPGVLLFYTEQYQLQYMEKTRNIKETVYNYLASDDETFVHPIRHLFHFLCYVKRKEDEERSALYYFLNRQLKPKWDRKSLANNRPEMGTLPEIDRYKQILRFSLTIEDLRQYLQRKCLEQPIHLDEVKEIADFVESMEKEGQIEEVIEQVLEICMKQYQKEKSKNSPIMSES